MFMHVEAKEGDYSLEKMKRICQNFLLLENVMDSFLPIIDELDLKSVTPTLNATFLQSWRCMIRQKDHWVLSFLAGIERIYTTKILNSELAKSRDRSTTIY